MTILAPVPAPGWLVALAVAVGLGVALLLARELSSLGYRLDDETGAAPLPAWSVVLAVPALWGGLAWQVGGVAAGSLLPALLLLATVGAALTWIDLDVHRLPEGLTLPSLAAMVVLLALSSAASGDWAALLRALLSGLGAWAVYLVLVLVSPSGLGFGDTVLGGLVSLPLGFLGWSPPFVALVAAYVVGGLVSLVLLALRRLSLKSHIAFGPFILFGALVALVVGLRAVGV